MWFSWGKGKHGVGFTEGASQRTQVTIEESSWDICVQLQPEVSANITRQATEDKTNGLWSAGDQGSLRLCLGSAAHLRLQLVALQLESAAPARPLLAEANSNTGRRERWEEAREVGGKVRRDFFFPGRY